MKPLERPMIWLASLATLIMIALALQAQNPQANNPAGPPKVISAEEEELSATFAEYQSAFEVIRRAEKDPERLRDKMAQFETLNAQKLQWMREKIVEKSKQTPRPALPPANEEGLTLEQKDRLRIEKEIAQGMDQLRTQSEQRGPEWLRDQFAQFEELNKGLFDERKQQMERIGKESVKGYKQFLQEQKKVLRDKPNKNAQEQQFELQLAELEARDAARSSGMTPEQIRDLPATLLSLDASQPPPVPVPSDSPKKLKP